jgi:signal transduction histidine kinase
MSGNAEAERTLPSAVDLTAYRVVQEALTNVQKHVGTGAHAEVRIVTRPEALEITVTDDGEGAADGPAAETGGAAGRGNAPGTRGAGSTADVAASSAPAPASFRLPAHARESGPAWKPGPVQEPVPEQGGGHGLIGMRERAVALHGECETGPLPGGGFRVHVRLPIQQPRAAETGTPGFRTEEGASA